MSWGSWNNELPTEFECLACKREPGLLGMPVLLFAAAQDVDEVVGR